MDKRKEFDRAISSRYNELLRFPPESSVKQVNVQEFERRLQTLDRILNSDSEFYILYRSVNVTAMWLSMHAIAILNDSANDQAEEDPTAEQTVALSFFSKLANDLWAIIELIDNGFDLQARALARSYLEHIDVLICCIIDREVTLQFVDAVEPEAANEFWHKIVSKNKAKNTVAKFISSKIEGGESQIVNQLREDVENAGSQLLHPTVHAGLTTAFGHPDVEYQSYPIFPEPIPASAGIFRGIMIHHFWLSFALSASPRLGGGTWGRLIKNVKHIDTQSLDRLSVLYLEVLNFLFDNQLLFQAVDDE